MKKLIIISVIIIAAVWYGWGWFTQANNQISFRSVKAEKGDITQTVSATGTLQPIRLVQVECRINGPITKLYVDNNSRVKEGDIMAQIDPAAYEMRVVQEKANLRQSQAQIERAKANLIRAEKELKRANELSELDLISKAELDSAIANRDALIADLESSKASIEQSKTRLQEAEINLGYTAIKAPVDGVVISRDVKEGQTVGNYSQKPPFVIATDLKKFHIEASVSESDIGLVRMGQPVTFTVDSYPQIQFTGEAVQRNFSPNTVQNVVTYIVIVSADNPDEKLLPGMTANLIFEVARRTNVLKVPNAALRFRPDPSMIDNAPDSPPPAGQGVQTAGNNPAPEPVQLWIKTSKGLKPITINIGISDEKFTEVIKGDITEGQEIITGIIEETESDQGRKAKFHF
ncbi:MAG: efflux RND transporter periplasmic adaptor subunit [Planctomycetota bacterium]